MSVREWFKSLTGGKKKKRAKRRRLPKRQLAPVADIVEQELLVADVAVRMSVKNEIIMNALAKRVNYDREEIRGLVKKSLASLAEQRELDSENIAAMREEIRRRGRTSRAAQYGGEDSGTLKHREEVYAGVAEQLRARLDNDDYISENADKAHELAWIEIADSLKNRAEHPYYSGGHSEEYQAARADRIQQLIAKDLTELVRQQSGRRKLFRRDKDKS